MLVLAAAAAGAGAWWSYGRSTPPVSGWRRIALSALRATVIFVVFLLLFEPILRRIVGRDEDAVVAVLLDDTRSLSASPGGTVDPRALVADALAGLPTADRYVYYRFGPEASRLGGRPDSLALEGERTDISSALRRVQDDLAGRSLGAILLVSDGRFTTGRNPVWVAARYPVPVYTSVVGDSTAARDARVSEVLTNDIAYVGSELPVRVVVSATGYEGRRARVVLAEGGRALTAGEVVLPSDAGEATLDLAITPGAPGLRRYVASIEAQPGEATARNNAASVTVRVLDQRRRLLVVAGAPSPDLAALKAVIDADPQLEAVYRTQRSAGAFYEGPLPAEADRPAASGGFDAVVLVGYPGPAFDAGQAARLRATLTAGRPALFILTQQTDLAALARVFGDVLPASPEVIRPGWADGDPALTPQGATHPATDVGGGGADRRGTFERLPALSVSESRWALAPGARVLVTARRGGADTGVPLVVLLQTADRRAAAVLGAGTWRWRTLPADLAGLAGVFPRLIDNLVRWTTTTEDRRRVRVRPLRPAFAGGERVQFSGQVYDEALNPVSDAEIRLTITGPSRIARTMRALGSGRYSLDIGPLPPGRWGFEAGAARGGSSVGGDRGAFSVGDVADEFRHPGADPELMRQIALRSGGRVVPLDSLSSLTDILEADGRLEAQGAERAEETPLLDLPLLLVLLVAGLTVEWVLRKRWGMV